MGGETLVMARGVTLFDESFDSSSGCQRQRSRPETDKMIFAVRVFFLKEVGWVDLDTKSD
jgi:hypothetical protein